MSTPLDDLDDSEDEAPADMHFSDTSFSPALLKNLTRMRQCGELTDVTLKAGGVLLPCHRLVLSANSPYFHAMFTSDFVESQLPTVEIKSMDPTTLRTIIDYVYSAEITITTENVQALAQASNEFQFESLKNACEKFMLKHVRLRNCIGFYKLATLLSLQELREMARYDMLHHLYYVVHSLEFKEMTEADLVEYISDSDLIQTNEDQVFRAVVSWVNHNLPERRDSFETVLAHVRLPYCTYPFLSEVVKVEPLMSTRVCQDYLEEALKFHQKPDHRHELISPRTEPRKSFREHRLVVIGGILDGCKENDNCWFYKEGINSWEKLTTVPGSKMSSACVLGTEIVLVGGAVGFRRARKDCWVYETSDNEWKSIHDMKTVRREHAVVILHGKIYVIGGRDRHTAPVNCVSCYDFEKKKWHDAAPMTEKLSYPIAIKPSLFTYDIFVFGGLDKFYNASTTTQHYDSYCDVWTTRTEMPRPCNGGSAAAVNDVIYLVGGDIPTCMSYTHDFENDTWTILTPPRQVHHFCSAAVWKDRILLAGGLLDRCGTTSADIEEYDPDKDRWSNWKMPLKEGLAHHYMFAMDLPWL